MRLALSRNRFPIRLLIGVMRAFQKSQRKTKRHDGDAA